MAEMSLPTIMETGGGFGGMGAGLGGLVGGLVLGSIWGGGWGGFGGYGNRGAGQIGADVALQNGIQNVQNAVQQGAVAQAQGVGQLGMQMANVGAGVTQAVNGGTVANLQGFSSLGQQICCSTGRLSQEIDAAGDQTMQAINAGTIQGINNAQRIEGGLANLGQAVTNQGYQNQLQTKDVLAALSQQHAALSAQISAENCADRELMREIAAQQVRDKLAEAQAKIVQLETQNYVQQSNSQQTLYLVDQLKPAATTAAGA